jgi:hypothetical protein
VAGEFLFDFAGGCVVGYRGVTRSCQVPRNGRSPSPGKGYSRLGHIHKAPWSGVNSDPFPGEV